MNKTLKNSNWETIPSSNGSKENRTFPNAYESSLFGEYLRLSLVVMTIPLLLWFALSGEGSVLIPQVSTGILLWLSATSFGNKLIRVVLIIAATGMIGFVVWRSELGERMPQMILLAGLVVGSICECLNWGSQRSINRDMSEVNQAN